MHAALLPRHPPFGADSDVGSVNRDILQSINHESTVDVGPSSTRKRAAKFDPIVRPAKRKAISDHERRGYGARVDLPGVITRLLHYNHRKNGRGSIQIVSHFRFDPFGFAVEKAEELHAQMWSAEHRHIFPFNRDSLSYECDFCCKSIPVEKRANWETYLNSYGHK